MNIVALGILASLTAGLMTGVGALPVLVGRAPSQRVNDILLGFAAGVMLSASFFSLIVPGIEAGEAAYGSATAAALVAAGGLAAGSGFVASLNAILPHEHFEGRREGVPAERLARIWLFILAITIHNLPEGLAVGVGFGGENREAAVALATGIGLQNAPEGLAVAVALLGLGYGRLASVGIATLTGLVEPLGGALGIWAVSVSRALLPWGLTFAAGAMLYIISHEIIPDTHRGEHADAATTGLMVGLILMMLLDVTLG